jgi:hypothetical protein
MQLDLDSQKAAEKMMEVMMRNRRSRTKLTHEM